MSKSLLRRFFPFFRSGTKKKARKTQSSTAKAPEALPKPLTLLGGDANTVDIHDAATFLKTRIDLVAGRNCAVHIGEGTKISNAHITLSGEGNRLVIGRNCRFAGRIFIKGNGQTVSIGDETTTVRASILCSEGRDVTIGEHCMLSRGIEIRTTDAHSLVDRHSRKRVNTPKSVRIGNHVWVGMDVVISKGSEIPDDCMIAARSFVNAQFDEPGLVIAGTPAKIVKTGITWHRKRKRRFAQSELDFWK